MITLSSRLSSSPCPTVTACPIVITSIPNWLLTCPLACSVFSFFVFAVDAAIAASNASVPSATFLAVALSAAITSSA